MVRMKRLTCRVLVVLFFIFIICGQSSVGLATKNPEVYSQYNEKDNKEVIVKFKDDSSSESIKSAVKNKLKLSKLTTKKKLKKNNLEVLEIGEGENIDTVLNELKNNTNVLYAQPNYKLSINTLPTDVNFNQQWGLINSGQPVYGKDGTSGVDINAAKAWEITLGIPEVVVGVIDTGIDINHKDLKGNVFINTREIPGNGVDDDGNGFIDDVNGWDFINNDNTIFDNPQMDTHGTHVAGIIAASRNGEGTVGVAPGIKVLPLKFINGTNGYTSDAIEAIEYAEQMGVKIINCSWGGAEYNIALQEAMQDSDILYVCAAGNYSSSNAIYPAGFDIPNILSVGAIDNTGVFAPYSNYGTKVHIAAPGSNILSTLPGDGYGYLSGTSMAAPFVTGTAALIKSYLPDISTSDILNRIKNNSIKYDELKYKVTSGGRIDAYLALENTNTSEIITTQGVKLEDSFFINPDNKNLDEIINNPLNNSQSQIKRISKPIDPLIMKYNDESAVNSKDGINNLKIELIEDNILTVSWTTNKAMSSEFLYGKTYSLSEKKILFTKKNMHQISIKDFNVNEFKWYQIKSTSEDGKVYQTEISKIENIIDIKYNNLVRKGKTVSESVYNSVYGSVYSMNSLVSQNLIINKNMNVQDISIQSYAYESEVNDFYTNAHIVNTSTVYGSINSVYYDFEFDEELGEITYIYSEVDWYKVDLLDSSDLVISIGAATEGKDFDIEVYSSNMIYLWGSSNIDNYDYIYLSDEGYAPGTYYIKVSSFNPNDEEFYVDGYNPDYAYNLYFSGIIFSPDNYEQNNSRYTATPIVQNVPLYSNLHSITDEDWFSLYVDSKSKIIAKLSNIPANYEYYIAIYDANGYPIYGYDFYNYPYYTTFTAIAEVSGQYYIRVFTYYGGDSDLYEIKVTVVTPDTYELDDGIYDGNASSLGSVIWATIDNQEDQDWFNFSVSETAEYYFMLDNISSGCDYDITLYNSSWTAVGGSYLRNNNSEKLRIFLESGNYSIRVNSYSGSSQTLHYCLLANKYKPDAYELNESISTAKEIALNQSINASIDNTNDIDWFKVYLSITGEYNVNLDTIPSGCNYNVEVYDISNVLIAKSENSNNSTENILITIPSQGIYYVKVYSAQGANDLVNYTLTITNNNFQGNIILDCLDSNTYNVVISGSDIHVLNSKTYLLTYNKDQLDVLDLCSITSATELSTGSIPGTNITITEYSPGTGNIKFTVNTQIDPSKVWSGLINIIKFKSKSDFTGQSKISFEIQ